MTDLKSIRAWHVLMRAYAALCHVHVRVYYHPITLFGPSGGV